MPADTTDLVIGDRALNAGQTVFRTRGGRVTVIAQPAEPVSVVLQVRPGAAPGDTCAIYNDSPPELVLQQFVYDAAGIFSASVVPRGRYQLLLWVGDAWRSVLLMPVAAPVLTGPVVTDTYSTYGFEVTFVDGLTSFFMYAIQELMIAPPSSQASYTFSPVQNYDFNSSAYQLVTFTKPFPANVGDVIQRVTQANYTLTITGISTQNSKPLLLVDAAPVSVVVPVGPISIMTDVAIGKRWTQVQNIDGKVMTLWSDSTTLPPRSSDVMDVPYRLTAEWPVKLLTVVSIACVSEIDGALTYYSGTVTSATANPSSFVLHFGPAIV